MEQVLIFFGCPLLIHRHTDTHTHTQTHRVSHSGWETDTCEILFANSLQTVCKQFANSLQTVCKLFGNNVRKLFANCLQTVRKLFANIVSKQCFLVWTGLEARRAAPGEKKSSCGVRRVGWPVFPRFCVVFGV